MPAVAYKCGNDWLKSIVTFKKKSQTDKFFPKSRADLYLKIIKYFRCEKIVKSKGFLYP